MIHKVSNEVLFVYIVWSIRFDFHSNPRCQAYDPKNILNPDFWQVVVISKLFSIIYRQCFYPGIMFAKKHFNRFLDLICTSLLDLTNKLIFCLHFRKRYNSSLVIFADNGISFKMSNPDLLLAAQAFCRLKILFWNNTTVVIKVLSFSFFVYVCDEGVYKVDHHFDDLYKWTYRSFHG